MSHRSLNKPNNFIRLLWLTMWLITFFLVGPSQAFAASGMPDSTEFGYGAHLDLWGQEIDLAINAATAIDLDWVRIDFDWARHQPDPKGSVNLETLDEVMANIDNHQIDVLLSISNPPAWAKTPTGPNILHTTALITQLVNRYPDELLTIEVFPAANTLKGWGAPPDPVSYTALLEAAQVALQSSHSSAVIVGAGLTPLPPAHSPDDMDDIAFLNALYEAGAAPFMPIVGVRLNETYGEAMSPPDGNDPRVLRHYEAVRQVMLEHNHTNGLIWITGFTWPATTADTSEQVRWLIQAFNLTKSQLYIGVAFFDRLNPPAGTSNLNSPSLIQKDEKSTRMHPALGTFGQIITAGRTGQTATVNIYLYKKMIIGSQKSYLKSNLP